MSPIRERPASARQPKPIGPRLPTLVVDLNAPKQAQREPAQRRSPYTAPSKSAYTTGQSSSIQHSVSVAKKLPGSNITLKFRVLEPDELSSLPASSFVEPPAKENFIVRLYRLASNPDNATEIAWDEAGTSIIVFDLTRDSFSRLIDRGSVGAQGAIHNFLAQLQKAGFKQKTLEFVQLPIGRGAIQKIQFTHGYLTRDTPPQEIKALTMTEARRRSREASEKLGFTPNKEGFLGKLYRLLQDPSNAAALSWDKSGRHIICYDVTSVFWLRLLTDSGLGRGRTPTAMFLKKIHKYDFTRTVLECWPGPGARHKTIQLSHPHLNRDTPIESLETVAKTQAPAPVPARSHKSEAVPMEVEIASLGSAMTTATDNHASGPPAAEVPENAILAREFNAMPGFLRRLFQVANDPANKDIIRWNPTGDVIVLVDLVKAGTLGLSTADDGHQYQGQFKSHGFHRVRVYSKGTGKGLLGWKHPVINRRYPHEKLDSLSAEDAMHLGEMKVL